MGPTSKYKKNSRSSKKLIGQQKNKKKKNFRNTFKKNVVSSLKKIRPPKKQKKILDPPAQKTSRIWETKNLSTDANNRTNTIFASKEIALGGDKQTHNSGTEFATTGKNRPKGLFFEKEKEEKKKLK